MKALTKNETPNIYPFPRSEIRTIAYQLESDSPYQNNTTKPYEISIPGTKAISINFDLIDIENGYDYLQIESKSGAILKKITGHVSSGQTEFFDQNEIVLRIVSDNTETRQGFEIIEVKTLPVN